MKSQDLSWGGGPKYPFLARYGYLGVPLFDHFLGPFFDPFLAEIDAFQGAIWHIGGPKRGPKMGQNMTSFLTPFVILMPKVPKKWSFWDPLLGRYG